MIQGWECKSSFRNIRSRTKKLANERLRLKQMRQYEEKYSHCDYICGIDEVGRGPLAGPVVAAAVILPKDARFYI